MESNYRPSWEEYFKIIVENTATRSPCKRLQVGCLLVKENRIVSQGYNGFLPGCNHFSIVATLDCILVFPIETFLCPSLKISNSFT